MKPVTRLGAAMWAWRHRSEIAGWSTLGRTLVWGTLGIATTVLLEATLSFLGIGVQPPAPTWGGMLSSDLGYLGQRPWGPLAPVLAIVVTVGALNLVADAARDVLGADVPSKRKAVANV